MFFTVSFHLYKSIDTGFFSSNISVRHWVGKYILVMIKLYRMIEICSSAGFPKALGHLIKNSSCNIYYSQQPRVLLVISLLRHNYSMKPCTKGSLHHRTNYPLWQSKQERHSHMANCFCLCVHCHFETLQSKVFVLIFLRLILDETN